VVAYDAPISLPDFGATVTALGSSLEATCANGAADVTCRPARFSGVGPPIRARALSAGDFHICATNGIVVHCWGENGHGQLGRGDTVASVMREPVIDLPAMDVMALDAGGRSSCALMADRSMWCWGAPQPIDPSRGTLDFVLIPMQVMTNRRSIRVDEDVACGLGDDGQILCVGTSSQLLGFGTGPAPRVPVPVQL
jgi:hypothetical protein